MTRSGAEPEKCHCDERGCYCPRAAHSTPPAPAPQVESRSFLKRKAAMQGKPAPTFGTTSQEGIDEHLPSGGSHSDGSSGGIPADSRDNRGGHLAAAPAAAPTPQPSQEFILRAKLTSLTAERDELLLMVRELQGRGSAVAERPQHVCKPSCHNPCLLDDEKAAPQPSDERATQWISVEDRLPLSGYGQLLCANGRVVYGWLRTNPGPKSAKWETHGRVLQNVTHWMPLPEAPVAARASLERKP